MAYDLDCDPAYDDACAELEKAQAWLEQCKAFVPALVAKITAKPCPMEVTAKDYDLAIGCIQENICDLFHDQLAKLERIKAEMEEADDYSDVREHGTHWQDARRFA